LSENWVILLTKEGPMDSLKDKLLHRIRSKGRGGVYTSKDFLDLGTRAAVDQALSRLVKEGAVRRLGRGLFDYPRISPALGGPVSPDPDHVAQAVARKRGGRLMPSGASAANALGLSTQVPGRRVYATDSSTGSVKFGKQTLTLKRTAPKRLGTGHKVASTVVQALQHLGRAGIDDKAVKLLRATLSPTDKKALLRESRYAVGWISDAVKKIVQD
jgi:hypothetical protein